MLLNYLRYTGGNTRARFFSIIQYGAEAEHLLRVACNMHLRGTHYRASCGSQLYLAASSLSQRVQKSI